MYVVAVRLAAILTGFSISFGGGLDVAKLKKGVVAIAEKDYPTTAIKDPVCPKKIKKSKGLVSQCTILLNGKTLTYNITQTDGKGNVDILPVEAVISVHKAVDFLESTLKKARNEVVSVDCGKDDVIIAKPGTVVTCQAETPSQKGPVKFRVSDINGNVKVV